MDNREIVFSPQKLKSIGRKFIWLWIGLILLGILGSVCWAYGQTKVIVEEKKSYFYQAKADILIEWEEKTNQDIGNVSVDEWIQVETLQREKRKDIMSECAALLKSNQGIKYLNEKLAELGYSQIEEDDSVSFNQNSPRMISVTALSDESERAEIIANTMAEYMIVEGNDRLGLPKSEIESLVTYPVEVDSKGTVTKVYEDDTINSESSEKSVKEYLLTKKGVLLLGSGAVVACLLFALFLIMDKKVYTASDLQNDKIFKHIGNGAVGEDSLKLSAAVIYGMCKKEGWNTIGVVTPSRVKETQSIAQVAEAISAESVEADFLGGMEESPACIRVLTDKDGIVFVIQSGYDTWDNVMQAFRHALAMQINVLGYIVLE